MSEFWIKVEKTLYYYFTQLLKKIRLFRWKLSKPIAETPVFILGCSRAGTTLVYKTFSESRQLGTLHKETHDLWSSLHPPKEKNWDGHELTAEDASDHDRAFISQFFYTQTGTLTFVDKNNQNGLCLPYLLELFPKARFVYVKRSPEDNINSLIEGWRKADEFANWSGSLPVDIKIENGEFTRWCFFIAKGWQQYVNRSIEDVCAYQYRIMNEAIIQGRELVPAAQWTEIHYEDILHNPVNAFKNTFSALGLEFDEHMEQHCKTVLERPYNAFSEIRTNKWKDGRNAEKVQAALGSVNEIARKMGYSATPEH